MAPHNTRSVAAVDQMISTPPGRPERRQVKRSGTPTLARNPSNTSNSTSSTPRLVRQPSASPPSTTPPKQTSLSARKSLRSGVCPSSSRSALPTSALDPSQDHHRSDSGRSSGSSRSTATTDSFFLPQHPHTLNRRLKDLPAPPSSSSLSKLTDIPASASGLNVAIGPSDGPSSLPHSRLFRSESSVSTTPTSPEEGDHSPVEFLAPDDFSTLNNEKLKQDLELELQSRDIHDDLWKTERTYPTQLPESSTALLDRGDAAQEESCISTTSAVPLVAANLQKLNFQHLQAEDVPAAATKRSIPSTSSVSPPPSTVQASTKSGESHPRLSMPRVLPYQQPTASASSSSSAVDQRLQLNKSSSSLSTSSSAHEGDKGAPATASKRSSTSSSSSFRMTLSRQAKTLRNSFLWTPPSSVQTLPTSQERNIATSAASSSQTSSAPVSQSSSPRLPVSSPSAAVSELPSSGVAVVNESQQSGAAEKASSPGGKASGEASVRKNRSPMLRSSQTLASISSNRTTEHTPATASRSSITQSPKRPTDYSKTEERPQSRLSSRLMLHGTPWSTKISSLKSKKASEATLPEPLAPRPTLEALHRTATRKSKAGAARAPTSAAGARHPAETNEGKRSSPLRGTKIPAALVLKPNSSLTGERASTDAQISPSFAETFAFLNSHIDSRDRSEDVVAKPIAQTKDRTTPPRAKAQVSHSGTASSTDTLRGAYSGPSIAETSSALKPKTSNSALAAPNSLKDKSGVDGAEEDNPSKDSLFARLADSPEAVYRTLVLPDPEPMPASQSLDRVVPSVSCDSKRSGHKKQMSLGSATLISKSARKAAADLDKRASGTEVASSGLPLTVGRISTVPSLSNVLPAFTPVNEESHFFDALTSPLGEQPQSSCSTPSPDDSILPTFATAKDFFAQARSESPDPLDDRSSALASTAHVAASVSSSPIAGRTSLGRRLSGVFDASKARSVRTNVVASPPQSPRGNTMPLPARPETSLGFHLRNPLRRERKTSLAKPVPTTGPMPPPVPSKSTNTAGDAPSTRTKSAASAIRKMSSNFRLDRTSPAKAESVRPGTSLGFVTSGSSKSPGAFSNRVLAPTKSSLARAVTPSRIPASTSTARSTSASALVTTGPSPSSRSPQRPLNPPSSFRGGITSGSRLSVFANGSPFRSMPSKTSSEEAGAGLVDGRASLSSECRSDAPVLTPEVLSSSADVLKTSATPAAMSGTSGSSDLRSSAFVSDLSRRRTLSKPVLRPIRTSFAEEGRHVRPTSAMGFRPEMTGQDRKMSQPTLDMVDDREFLEALEQVRQVHRERIQAEAREVENKTRLARLGMMSGNYLKTKVSGSMLDDDDVADLMIGRITSDAGKAEGETRQSRPAKGNWSDASKALTAAGSRLRHKRSASADAKLGRSRSPSETSRDSAIDRRQKDIVRAYTDKKVAVGPPTTGLEWGVGKASGKLHDGTFVNDDDWKKEVKALFLIRELVQTERSYARHLGSLLSVVRKMQTGSASSTPALGMKRKSSSNLFSTYSSVYTGKASTNAAVPSHIALLRLYLPQLIALSKALVQRVEDNPTSAGVGAAFDTLAVQLESTFVGWSAVASQAMKDLRLTELAKGKSPYKIGLVPLMPRESTEEGASTTDASGSSGSSSPGSGFRHSTLRMTSLTSPPSPVKARDEPDAKLSSDGAATTLSVSRSTKRRSTITSTSFIASPRVATASAPWLFTSPADQSGRNEAGSQDSKASATVSRRAVHSRSQSTFATPLVTPTSSIGHEPWSALSMTSSTTLAPNGAVSNHAPQLSSATAKCLTPMDIAIMPTQRIPRYGLMLRDLLRNTPPESLSHARVQRAITLIQKVAMLCDSAAPMPTGGVVPSSGSATPLRTSSVLSMASRESLSIQPSPLLSASGFLQTKRN